MSTPSDAVEKQPTDTLAMPVEEAARLIGVSRTSTWNLIKICTP